MKIKRMKNKWEREFDEKFDTMIMRRQAWVAIYSIMKEFIRQTLANERKRIADRLGIVIPIDFGDYLLDLCDISELEHKLYKDILAIINKEE